ncbi:MAG: membrane protein insertion efficiency factor YidD [Candidatus Hydrogenedentes bacterium]|nr:membrane protein insertion efficiency factor YidD [Candidatus Hydrogenedentota bacterium]
MIIDSLREPDRQVSGCIYIHVVQEYQVFARPTVRNYAVCRYAPSCSQYSIGAVSEHGIIKGLFLTVKRISSCGKNVPFGTLDPVPT